MQTRRELLFTLASATIPVADSHIFAENDCLSQESARGFRLLLRRVVSGNIIILPGSRGVSLERAVALRRAAMRGALVVIEGAPAFRSHNVIRDVFGFELQPPRSVANTDRLYIQYTWPVPRLVRHFSSIMPVCCLPSEKIAEFAGITVCAKRRVGRGAIIFLGSMLGPVLLAEEKEAHDVTRAILRSAATSLFKPEEM